jgi:hypothetical protein
MSCTNLSGDNVYTGEFADGATYNGTLKIGIATTGGSNLYNSVTTSFTAVGQLTINNQTYCCRTSGVSGSMKQNTGYYYDGFQASDVGGIQSLSLICSSTTSFGSSGSYNSGAYYGYNAITITMPQRMDYFGAYPYVYLTGDNRLEGCFSASSNIQNPIPGYFNVNNQVYCMGKDD